MAASSVVVLEPGCQGCGAFVVAGEGLAVGPFGEQGAVEAFGFPVLPGAVRLDEDLFDAASFSADLAQGPAVGPGVVGHQPLDAGDAVGCVVAQRSVQEVRAGPALLVGEDLAVGQPRVVVDHGVDVVEPDLGVPVTLGGPGPAAHRLPAAAVGDAAELSSGRMVSSARIVGDSGPFRWMMSWMMT